MKMTEINKVSSISFASIRIILLVALVFISLPVSCFAAKWIPVVAGASGTTWLFESESLRHDANGLTSGWMGWSENDGPAFEQYRIRIRESDLRYVVTAYCKNTTGDGQKHCGELPITATYYAQEGTPARATINAMIKHNR